MLRLYGKIGIMYTNPIRGGVPVKVTIYQEPCWLLEAAELVYGLVNQIPVEKLAGSGPYCIPPDQVRRIQAEVCAGLNPLDEVIQFYFRESPWRGFPTGSLAWGARCCTAFWKLIIRSQRSMCMLWRRIGTLCVNMVFMWRELTDFL